MYFLKKFIRSIALKMRQAARQSGIGLETISCSYLKRNYLIRNLSSLADVWQKKLFSFSL